MSDRLIYTQLEIPGWYWCRLEEVMGPGKLVELRASDDAREPMRIHEGSVSSGVAEYSECEFIGPLRSPFLSNPGATT